MILFYNYVYEDYSLPNFHFKTHTNPTHTAFKISWSIFLEIEVGLFDVLT